MSEAPVHGQESSEGGGEGASSPQGRVPLQSAGAGAPVARGFSTQVSSSRVPDPRPVSPTAGPFLRCYNCGELGHLTKNCPSHGPYWPAPGKTRDDYAEKIQEISNRHAADIIREHEEGYDH